MLAVGLLTEAFCAFRIEPVDNELDWSLVYPELATGVKVQRQTQTESVSDSQGMLSQKLDAMLKDAKIDGGINVKFRK
jgi:gliding motility-associated protein GldL